MQFSIYILPCVILFVLIYGYANKVNIWQQFISGASKAIRFLLDIFPFLFSMFILCELFEVSGLSAIITRLLQPITGGLGIPTQLTKLMLIKPFSGSGSLAVLMDIYNNYGIDSYISRCGSIIYGSSESVFYISAIYFSKVKSKAGVKVVIISLIAIVMSSSFACLICKFM